ncbi:hypothetical protein Ancab_030051 [Ancistrocladus abbreviatus]
MLTSNCHPDMIIQNHIINMYGKCGSLRDAQEVFDVMRKRNAVTWTSLIAAYSQNGQEGMAIKLYFDMLHSGFMPDQYTFGSVLRACGNIPAIGLGKQLHAHVIKSVQGSHLIAQNALIAMYTKLEQIHPAFSVFSRIRTKNLISWGSIIAAFSQLGYELDSFHLFKEMLNQGLCQPNEFIFGSIINACCSLLQPEYGSQIHGMCIKFGLGRDIFAGSSLIDMYARCGFLDSALTVFHEIDSPDVVSWNAIMTGFSNVGDTNQAILLLSQMRLLGLMPNDITVCSLLCGCANPSAIWQGKHLHSYVVKTGFDVEVTVCNTLLTMYIKCSRLDDAFIMFNEFRSKADLISWNMILGACTQQNLHQEVFQLFNLMGSSFCKPDCVTFTNLLKACAQVTSLEMGKQVHCCTTKIGLELDMFVANGLIELYTRCGIFGSARNLFDCLRNPDVVSWSILISGYAQCGNGEEALKLFKTMRNLGVKPNEVTFLGVLTACSHVGLVEEGWQLYRNMEKEYGIVPTIEHNSCMIDLLARAGRLKEAKAFIMQMTFSPDIVVWKSLLSACRTHKDVDIGKWAAEKILEIDPLNSAAFALLCSIYSSAGNWEDVGHLRKLMKCRGVRKVPGQSWIEVKDVVHVFSAEESLLGEIDQVYAVLEGLYLHMMDFAHLLDWKTPPFGHYCV